GNLVLYDATGAPLWSSGTTGRAPGVAVMQDDGNFVVYDASGTAIWSTGTAGHAGASLAVQSDGKLVGYDASGDALHATRTARRAGAGEPAGGDRGHPDLPVSPVSSPRPGRSLHSNESITSPDGRYRLIYQTDGNLVLYDSNGAARWSSGTVGSTPGVAVM